jgi:hypothetical protein
MDRINMDLSTAEPILRIGKGFLELEGSDTMMEIELSEPPKPASRRNVSFGETHIREYSQILGDHPCCLEGPPVSLGWDYSEEKTCSIDDYEEKRCPCRRPRHELRLSFDDRRNILADIPEEEVKRGCRRLHRDRKCSGKAMQSFFGSPHQIAVTE